jgi:hypothetical protein
MPVAAAHRWSVERVWGWYDALPFLAGANFCPSTAINQLEMWQGETFDPVTIDRELRWAAKLGMNVMRVFLHDLLWEHDAAGFCERIEKYLVIASAHHIRTMFVIFDDCWLDTFALGTQPAPKPGTHNSGWIQSPSKKVVNDPSQWGRLEKYVTELLRRFRDDRRIVAWDLYNEPGNGTAGDSSTGVNEKQGSKSLPLLEATFAWARSVANLSQPLTVGPWGTEGNHAALNAFELEHSDFITFHSYEPPMKFNARMKELLALGRPLMCTEYMARGAGNTFEQCLRMMKKNNVGAIHWGLVAGKTQTIYPWGWDASKGTPDIWFHDVFNPDGTLLYPYEFREVLGGR